MLCTTLSFTSLTCLNFFCDDLYSFNELGRSCLSVCCKMELFHSFFPSLRNTCCLNPHFSLLYVLVVLEPVYPNYFLVSGVLGSL
jgi:hypothetical protein